MKSWKKQSDRIKCFLEQPLPKHVPSVSTLRDIFTYYLDINAVPRRSFFELLQHFASDELECEKLTEFSSLVGQVFTHFFSRKSSEYGLTCFCGKGGTLRLLPSCASDYSRSSFRISISENTERVHLRPVSSYEAPSVFHSQFSEGEHFSCGSQLTFMVT